jgi:signal transduction histidine kinase
VKLLSSLTNRIFAGTAALVVLAIAVAVSRVTVSVTERSETELQRGLSDAAMLVEEFSHTQVDRFERDARLIASLPVLRGAVATGDRPTVQPIADEYQRLLNGDVLVVTDWSGGVLASSGRFAADPAVIPQVLAAKPSGESGTWFWKYPGGVLLVTAVPMEWLGTLVVGTSLDQQVVNRLQELTRSDIALLTGQTVIVSTLGPAHAAALGRERGGMVSDGVRLQGEEYATRGVRLAAAGVGGAELVAMVLRSRTEQTAFLAVLHREIALTGVAAVLVATLLGYGIARTVTRPLRAVTATMREMAATGNLASAAPVPGRWDDEDARLLSTTFRQMTASLDRFQRDVAQRERLASLGRLSAVVAHEVRNPLMIIKAAVRSLRRAQTADVVETVAGSIEEEVARLNHVVTDVLDFARPLHFTLAPVDIATLCRDVATAAAPGPDDAAVVLEIDPALEGTTLITDAERVRAVLINVLANAQQAVRDQVDSVATPALQLRAWRTPDAGVRLTVVDAGRGIAAVDLPQVFEPFYTTRRSGTGLGLAITRNIVQGLGGTIQVVSDVGRGTRVDIELPPTASARGEHQHE